MIETIIPRFFDLQESKNIPSETELIIFIGSSCFDGDYAKIQDIFQDTTENLGICAILEKETQETIDFFFLQLTKKNSKIKKCSILQISIMKKDDMH